MKIGVIGAGFVGHAMTCVRPYVEVIMWDIVPEKRTDKFMELEEFVNMVEIVFVAVPTPMKSTGECDLSIVESVVSSVKQVDNDKPIILRSTVPPGTTERLGVSFMPEFLTERNWEQDFRNCNQWILGSHDHQLLRQVKQMYELAYNGGLGSVRNKQVIMMKPDEAEMVKYVKNCFLAAKVSFFNEMHAICEKLDVDYDMVRAAIADDHRIGPSHTQVPGPDGKHGYGGTCFPKDTNALSSLCKSHDIPSPVLDACIKRNETIDRPEKDWTLDTGRAVSEE